jgi:hypothetical protein
MASSAPSSGASRPRQARRPSQRPRWLAERSKVLSPAPAFLYRALLATPRARPGD